MQKKQIYDNSGSPHKNKANSILQKQKEGIRYEDNLNNEDQEENDYMSPKKEENEQIAQTGDKCLDIGDSGKKR